MVPRKTSNGYEIACGHHRLEALKRVGISHVDLAVQNYTDEEMLKIMIRENSTQRGNENFGAVLDSIGAVLVSCVKDTMRSWPDWPGPKKDGNNPIQTLKNGKGIGRNIIKEKEPSLIEKHIKTAFRTFRTTGVYLELLKKGGLPEEYWHLYEKEPITTRVEHLHPGKKLLSLLARLKNKIILASMPKIIHIWIAGG